MIPEDELKLSFYRPLSDIDDRKTMTLVQHVETRELFVRKTLDIYDRDVYEYLREENYAHIPAIKEIIEDDEKLIIIEEYIQGKRLDEVMEERSFSENDVRKLAIQICDILMPIHSHRPALIHRDIKPGNLILQGEQLYLIDFNASRDYDPDEAKDTVLMGTKDYAAPEQFGFSQSTPRTDIYAIGVLINVLLTGKTPTELPAKGNIGNIIKKCTAIDPDDRYVNVDELKQALMGRSASFALPGFRARHPALMILAGLWYLIIIMLSLTMDVNSSDGTPAGPAETVATRFATLVILGGMTLYIGNYRSFLELFPFKRRAFLPLEILRVALGCAIILFVPIIVVVVLFA